MCAPFRSCSRRPVGGAEGKFGRSPYFASIPALRTAKRLQIGYRAFSCVLLFRDADRIMPVHVRLRQNDFHFAHRDHWQEANEEEEEREENSMGADEGPDVDPGRNEQSPRAWQKITVQSADDDDETLEPHPGVDAHADEINDEDIAPAPAGPEELR